MFAYYTTYLHILLQQVNPMMKGSGDDKSITVAELETSVQTQRYSGKPDHKFFLDFDFQHTDDGYYHHSDYYSFYGGNLECMLIFWHSSIQEIL